MSEQTFYEARWARAIYPILFVPILVIALQVPIVSERHWLRISLFVALAATGIWFGWVLIKRRLVIVLADDALEICGVRPGVGKLFQLWHRRTIPLASISQIRIGYIRENHFGLSIPPLGEPSRNSMFQYFLWIHYDNAGQAEEIYYPHLKNVVGYRDLVEALRQRLGSRVREFHTRTGLLDGLAESDGAPNTGGRA